MKYLLLALPLALSAEEPSPPEKKVPPTTMSSAKSVFHIDPKARATDLLEAYQMLKTDKPTFKISLRGKEIYQNLIDLTSATNGTLLFIKIVSNHGSKTIIVPTEEIEEITYSQ